MHARRIVATTLAVGLAACDASGEAPLLGSAGGAVMSAVAAANREGRAAATLSGDHSHDGARVTLDQLSQRYSLVVLQPAHPVEVARTAADSILTWNRFTLAETIVKRSADAEACTMTVPEGLAITAEDVVLPLFKGSVVAGGVTVTADTPESVVSFQPGRTYLAFVVLCPNQIVRLPFGPYGVFEVSVSQAFKPMLASPSGVRPFMDDMDALGTLTRLRLQLK
jgi:hypothetical protein